ncbi:hypothetical protein [Saccharomonospora piscinae]|uniref:hypothetical protein n=1 Tax=Saccharomonospora piscinae TaxID=687388 RepID=UPI0004636ACA|nr:hypothetical protein [Saccharomonospora piscinae]TLW93389.1 hypothetical protein FFT09_08280 [Saccharomonospora piscinae]
MPKPEKLKKWRSQARRHAEQAESAAERAEAALRRIEELTGTRADSDSDGAADTRSPVYTSSRGRDDTPPAAEVP